jgi:hypothetical protein
MALVWLCETSVRMEMKLQVLPRKEGFLMYFFSYGSTALYGPGPPRFVEVSWWHTLDTPQSVGLLWTRDQLVAETTIWQHTTVTRDRHPCPRCFFCLFFPFDPFLYCLNPFVLHVTLRSILPSLQHNTTQTSMPPVGRGHWDRRIRTHDPSKRAAEDPCLRPHGHWDRHDRYITSTKLPNDNVKCKVWKHS